MTFASIAPKDILYLLTSNFFVQLVGFSSQLFVAWVLKPEEIGQIKILQSFAFIFSIIAGMGFNTSVLKLCSENRDQAEKQFLIKSAFKYTIASSLIIYFVIFLLAQFNLWSDDYVINHYIPLYSIIIIPTALSSLFTAYLQAEKMFKTVSSVQIYSKSFSIALIIVLTYIYSFDGYIYAAITGLFLSSFLLLNSINLRRFFSIPLVIKNSFHMHWHLAKYSVLANVLGQVALYLDIFIINFLISDKSQIGYYSFALTLLIPLQIFTATVQQYTTPTFSHLSNDIKIIKDKYNHYNKKFIRTASVFGLISIISSPIIIPLIFNGKYDESITYFQLLVISWWIRNFYALKGTVILGLGKIHLNFFSALMSMPIAFTLSFFMIKNFSLIGAAIGNLLGGIVMLIFVHAMLVKSIRTSS